MTGNGAYFYLFPGQPFLLTPKECANQMRDASAGKRRRMKKPRGTSKEEQIARWTTPRAGSRRFPRTSAGRPGFTGRKTRRAIREPRYFVMVVELDDAVPRRVPGKSNLYVALTVQDPAKRYKDLEKGKGPAWLRGHLVGLRDDLSSGPFLLREEAAAERDAAVSCLGKEGFTVNRGAGVWTVYVIELDPKGAKDPGKGFVYVGQTSRTPEERFEQHKKGKRNKRGPLFSPIVRRYGVRLRMDLAPDTVFFSRASAEAAEKRWAEKLRAEGYRVAGGH